MRSLHVERVIVCGKNWIRIATSRSRNVQGVCRSYTLRLKVDQSQLSIDRTSCGGGHSTGRFLTIRLSLGQLSRREESRDTRYFTAQRHQLSPSGIVL